jgi:hypothetical protein
MKTIKTFESDSEIEYSLFNDSDILMGYYVESNGEFEVYCCPVEDEFTMIEYCFDAEEAESIIIDSFETV